MQDIQIAAKLRIMPEKAARWRNRFLDGGLAALDKDAPRPGRTPTITPAKIQEVIRKTTQEKPGNATHWGTSMAKAAGLSEKSVRRIWHKHGLKPHLSRTFKVSNDPQFAEKLEAIIGLYLNPPEHTIRRRKEPDPSAGSHAAWPSAEEGALRNHDPRLQAQRNRHPVHGNEHSGWHRDQHVRRPAP
jgi:hypothetical protein